MFLIYQMHSDRIYIIGWFIWFAFLDNFESNIPQHDLQIPVNCEFFIIQRFGDTSYKLTETYKVKNKSFSFDFGTWDGVLNITNISSNRRRSNFNGTTINIMDNHEFAEKVSIHSKTLCKNYPQSLRYDNVILFLT